MKIGIIGGGVVGSALASTFRKTHEVRVFDAQPDRRTHSEHDTLSSDLVFVCLPETVVEDFLKKWSPSTVNYVIKSTVPIGTTRRLAEQYGLKNVVHSPEFLTARTAEYDAANPRVNIIGTPSGRPNVADGALQEFYRREFPPVETLLMSSDESEAVKLFMNSFFAVKVAYFNEIRVLADKLGLDWEVVRSTMVDEGRISALHTHVPGPDGKRGFGGACLPKDLKQLIQLMIDVADPQCFPYVCRSAEDRNNLIDRRL